MAYFYSISSMGKSFFVSCTHCVCVCFDDQWWLQIFCLSMWEFQLSSKWVSSSQYSYRWNCLQSEGQRDDFHSNGMPLISLHFSFDLRLPASLLQVDFLKPSNPFLNYIQGQWENAKCGGISEHRCNPSEKKKWFWYH